MLVCGGKVSVSMQIKYPEVPWKQTFAPLVRQKPAADRNIISTVTYLVSIMFSIV